MSYKAFTKNVGFIGFSNLLAGLEKLIILPVITKMLGAEDYGIWSQIGVTISLVSPLALLGLNGSMVRFLVAEKDRKKMQEGVYSVMFLVLSMALIIGLIIALLSQTIANFFQTDQILIKILSFIIVFECLDMVLFSFMQVLQEIKKYSALNISKIFCEAVLVIAAILLGWGLYGAVVSLLIIRIVVFLILFIFALRKIGITIPSFSPIKEYLKFGLPRILSTVSYWTVTSSDRYLIGFFMGVLFVGYYSPAYSIGNAINFFLYPLFFMLPIALSKAFDQNNISEVKTYLKYSLKYFLALAFPMFFGISVLSRQFLIIFSTKEIAENSFYITPFAALSILLYGLTSLIGSQILMLVKKTKIIGVVWMLAALLNLGLNFIFIPLFGILGAAITTLIAYSFAFALIWYYSQKELSFKINYLFIIKSAFSSVVMALFIFWINPMGFFPVILAVFSGALIYGVLMLLLKAFDKKEFIFLKEIFS